MAAPRSRRVEVHRVSLHTRREHLRFSPLARRPHTRTRFLPLRLPLFLFLMPLTIERTYAVALAEKGNEISSAN